MKLCDLSPYVEKFHALEELHDFLTENLLYKQKQLDDISVRRIKPYYSRVVLKALPILRNRGKLYLKQFELQYQYYKSK